MLKADGGNWGGFGEKIMQMREKGRIGKIEEESFCMREINAKRKSKIHLMAFPELLQTLGETLLLFVQIRISFIAHQAEGHTKIKP